MGLKMEDLSQTLRELLEELRQAAGADIVTLLRFDDKNDRFHSPIGVGDFRDRETFDALSMQASNRWIGEHLADFDDTCIAGEPGMHPILDRSFSRRECIRAARLCLLRRERRLLGALFVSYRSPCVFDAGLVRTTEAYVDRAAALLATAPAPAAATPPPMTDPQALQSVLDLVCDGLGKSIAVWMVDPDPYTNAPQSSRLIRIVAQIGLTRAFVAQGEAQVGDGSPPDLALRRGSEQAIPDLRKLGQIPRVELAIQCGWEAADLFPIRHAGNDRRISGVIVVLHYEGQSLSQGDRQIFRRLAPILAVTIENIHRHRGHERLQRATAALRKARDLTHAKRLILKHACELVRGNEAHLFLFKPGTRPSHIGHRWSMDGPGQAIPLRGTQYGAHSRRMLEDKAAVVVDRMDKDRHVDEALLDHGFRSLVGAPLIAREGLGVLYVNGERDYQFSPNDRELLRHYADQAALLLGWSESLRDDIDEIERASSGLFGLDALFDDIYDKIAKPEGVEYFSIQLVQKQANVIETVYAKGRARDVLGLRHYLHKEVRDRDIQADLVLAKPNPRAEIIEGWDDRFHQWVFDRFDHQRLRRLWTPIVLVRRPDGRPLHSWAGRATWHPQLPEINAHGKRPGRRTVLTLDMPYSVPYAGHEIEIIGTVEFGYDRSSKGIDVELARTLAVEVSKRAWDIHRKRLGHLLETLVSEVLKVAGADSAAVYFPLNQTPAKGTKPPHHAYELGRGEGMSREFLRTCRPRHTGLGAQALSMDKPRVAPKPDRAHDNEALRETNPRLYEIGVRSMAAFPISIDDQQGLFYVHYRDLHAFSDDEIAWTKLFTARAAAAIRDTILRDRLLDSERRQHLLQSVIQSLGAQTDERELLDVIAWGTVNLLAADLVTLFEYDARSNQLGSALALAGRVREPEALGGPREQYHSAYRLVAEDRNIYSSDEKDGTKWFRFRQSASEGTVKRKDFTKREAIRDVAGVILRADGEPVGAMFINFRRQHIFDESEKRLIEIMASAAAIAIRKTRELRDRQLSLSTLTHQLQGPLNAAVGAITSHFALNPTYSSTHLRHAHALVDDALMVSWGIFAAFGIDLRTAVSFPPEAVDMGTEIKALCDRLQTTQSLRGCRFIPRIGKNVSTTIEISRDVLSSVLYSLLHNAIMYADSGTEIAVAFDVDESTRVHFVGVRSRGPVIEDAERERVFGKFQRGRVVSTKGSHHHGSGLGLWVARTLMRKLGGDVVLVPNRTDPKVSEFRIWFRSPHDIPSYAVAAMAELK